jgi:hypothetical protein
MRARGRVALALVALVALVAAGCGGGDDDTDRTAGSTPSEILDQSAAALAAESSYRLEFDATLDVQTAPGAPVPTQLRPLLAGVRAVSGSGPVAPPDASLDVALDLGLFTVQANVTKVDGDIYLSGFGRDFRLLIPQRQIDAIDPGAAPATLVSWIQDPQEVSRQEIDGEPTVTIRGDVDVDRATAAIGRLLGSELTGDALRTARGALTGATVEVTVRTADLLPARVALAVDAERGQAQEIPFLERLTADVRLDLSDFGTDAAITAPQNARAIPLEELAGLIG